LDKIKINRSRIYNTFIPSYWL